MTLFCFKIYKTIARQIHDVFCSPIDGDTRSECNGPINHHFVYGFMLNLSQTYVTYVVTK